MRSKQSDHHGPLCYSITRRRSRAAARTGHLPDGFQAPIGDDPFEGVERYEVVINWTAELAQFPRTH
jgi:hypothetical protein